MPTLQTPRRVQTLFFCLLCSLSDSGKEVSMSKSCLMRTILVNSVESFALIHVRLICFGALLMQTSHDGVMMRRYSLHPKTSFSSVFFFQTNVCFHVRLRQFPCFWKAPEDWCRPKSFSCIKSRSAAHFLLFYLSYISVAWQTWAAFWTWVRSPDRTERRASDSFNSPKNIQSG